MWTELLLCVSLTNHPFLVDIVFAFISLFLVRVHVSNTTYVRTIDRHILKHGCTACIHIAFCETTPGDGFHIIFQGKWPILAFRKTSVATERNDAQTIYTLLSFHIRPISSLLYQTHSGGSNVCVVDCEQLSAYCPTTISSSQDLSNIKPWPCQEDVVLVLIQSFMKNQRASVLLSGPTGVGKSEIGVLLAHRIQTSISGVRPIVVHGLDLTAGGCSIMKTIPAEIDPHFPYILVLDEIDRAFATAENGNQHESLQFGRIASNKTSLCAELSRLSHILNLIVIGTTNVEENCLRKLYPAYVRPGRFDSIMRM